MKKSIGVLILGLILILNLFGCGKKEEVKEEVPVDISTGDNISGDNKNLDSSGSKDSNIITNTEIKKDTSEEKIVKESSEISENNFPKLPKNWEELSEEALAKYLPECEFEELKSTKIINIDDVVQNCTTEEIKGYLSFDGGATIHYNTYLLSKNGKVLEQTFGFHDTYQPICKTKNEGFHTIWSYMPVEEMKNIEKEREIISFEDFFNEKRTMIDNIVTVKGGNNTSLKSQIFLYCRKFCEDWREYTAIKKGEHYIISSMINPNGGNYVDNEYFNLQLIYTIDGKKYNPGTEKKKVFKKDYYYPNQSKRYFTSFSGDTVIVKRISDGKVLDDIASMSNDEFEKYWENNMNSPAVDYTIETCEIKLD